MTPSVEVREASAGEMREIADIWRQQWSGEIIVTRGTAHRITDVRAVVAKDAGRLCGAATFRMGADGCEVVSLDALSRGVGIGSTMLAEVESIARREGAQRVWMITTNDNVEALRFYQRRGYLLTAVHAGAVDEARRIKPYIPVVGEHGIPIHDEIELEKRL